MLFVQQEYYSTLTADIASSNAGVSITSQLSSDQITKINSDYETLIEIFILNKDAVTPELIIEFIGNSISKGSVN